MWSGAISAVALFGCVAIENLQSADADLARQVIAEHCVIGTWQSSDGSYRVHVEKMRLGRVSKRNDPITFRSFLPIHAEQVYVHGVRTGEDGWGVVDASSGGVRDNLYLDSGTGAFACSIDEWRVVQDFPERFAFEKSPLIAPNGGTN